MSEPKEKASVTLKPEPCGTLTDQEVKTLINFDTCPQSDVDAFKAKLKEVAPSFFISSDEKDCRFGVINHSFGPDKIGPHYLLYSPANQTRFIHCQLGAKKMFLYTCTKAERMLQIIQEQAWFTGENHSLQMFEPGVPLFSMDFSQNPIPSTDLFSTETIEAMRKGFEQLKKENPETQK